MTIQIDLVTQFSDTTRAAHALPEWGAFKAAKSNLKNEFRAIDTIQFSRVNFFAALEAKCGPKTVKKIMEFVTKKETEGSGNPFFTVFNPESTETVSFSASFLAAGESLEESTKAITSKTEYQDYRTAKKALKKSVTKVVNTGGFDALVAGFEAFKRDFTGTQDVDLDKITAKIGYWAVKASQK